MSGMLGGNARNKEESCGQEHYDHQNSNLPIADFAPP